MISDYLTRKRAERHAREYRRGYDWAAGALLAGEETPDTLECYLIGTDYDAFDRGANSAIRDFDKLKEGKK